MTVDTGNRTTVSVGGEELVIEASNGACFLYAKEFRDQEQPPYSGNLISDISTEVAQNTEANNFYPLWCDLPHVVQAIWAMAKAAGSTKDSFKTFNKKLMESTAVYLEASDVVRTLFGDFGRRTFFRGQERLDSDRESDEIQEAE